MKDNTEWFAKSGWGILCHWLAGSPGEGEGAGVSVEEWNRQVDAFDADALAEQLAAIGAPYFFITIGQNSGHYIAPNAAYDRHVGIQPGKCSRRDLVSDIYDCLHKRGIELLVYLPCGAPAGDPIAIERLGWETGYDWQKQGKGKRLAEFQIKWQDIVREWSNRWGKKVRGWWIDGCYFPDDMYRHDDEPNFRSLVAALKAGNPDSIVAFNPGVIIPVICHTEHEDYTAGEISQALPECPGAWVDRNGHKARYHILSHLGESWCTGAPRFPDELVAGYTRHVTEKGGVITWDVPMERSGLMPKPFMKQLTALGKSMRK